MFMNMEWNAPYAEQQGKWKNVFFSEEVIITMSEGTGTGHVYL